MYPSRASFVRRGLQHSFHHPRKYHVSFDRQHVRVHPISPRNPAGHASSYSAASVCRTSLRGGVRERCSGGLRNCWRCIVQCVVPCSHYSVAQRGDCTRLSIERHVCRCHLAAAAANRPQSAAEAAVAAPRHRHWHPAPIARCGLSGDHHRRGGRPPPTTRGRGDVRPDRPVAVAAN